MQKLLGSIARAVLDFDITKEAKYFDSIEKKNHMID
jgi:hypothetical protein